MYTIDTMSVLGTQEQGQGGVWLYMAEILICFFSLSIFIVLISKFTQFLSFFCLGLYVHFVSTSKDLHIVGLHFPSELIVNFAFLPRSLMTCDAKGGVDLIRSYC